MKTRIHILSGPVTLLAILLLLGGIMSGCALGNTVKWKEEVLLHDGQKIIVERWETTDPHAFREPFQPDPVSEVGLWFTPPGMDKKVEWKSEWGMGLQDNLNLLFLDFKEGTPYIATIPIRCQAYNKWGRPNPPYVIFKYDGQAWQRIPMEEFPEVFKEANVVVWYGHKFTSEEKAVPYLTVDMIKKINNHKNPDETQYRQYLTRQPITKGDGVWRCEELIYYKGGWIMPNDPAAREMQDIREQMYKDKKKK